MFEILKRLRRKVNTKLKVFLKVFLGVALKLMRKYNGGMEPAIFTIRLGPELKEEIGKAADQDGLPMNEYMARVLADHLGCPELAKIPRKSMGRPRKEMILANGKHRRELAGTKS